MSAKATETFSFQADVNQVLGLVVNSLYSNKEIFLRELISNASDAIDKREFLALTDKSLLDGDTPPGIRLIGDKEARRVTIEDDGVGMSRDELIENLGTIAHSGTQAFLKQLEEGQDVSLIGQFGVGFYSAFLVADDVEVISRAAGSEEAWRWRSTARGEFSVEAAEREVVGTTIVLHLKEEQEKYAAEWELRGLIRRYSDFVSHPIAIQVTRSEKPEGADEDVEEVEVTSFERINEASALWQRSREEITDEQYEEFYRHLTHDFEPALAHNHFRIEGTQLFTGLLYVPKRAPFDLFHREARRGVRLYVKRVFIMDDCEDLVPHWLRFVRGVIDSDDLPLNVSRELLQDSRVTRTIRKQVVKKTLDLLERLASEEGEDYGTFWTTFGAVLKEGIHYEPEQTSRLAKLLRFESTTSDGLTSLEEYVGRMPEEQKAIYFITGPSRAAVESGPHLEGLRSKGCEVLFWTDPIDELVASGLTEFDGKPLKSALSAELDLDDVDEEQKKAREDREEALAGLREAMGEVLSESVKEVRVSTRLTDSPVCLVVPDGGLSAHLERLLRAQQGAGEMPVQKRIFEINADHALITRLEKLHETEPKSDRLKGWIELLYEQALLTEGSPLPDPNRFARRVTLLMEEAASAAVTAE